MRCAGCSASSRRELLRGGKMEDVIFQGSSAPRRPVNVAEVSLHFDNDDGDLPIAVSSEVVITRRLSRSGDSEYLLNKAPCGCATSRTCCAARGSAATRAWSSRRR